MNNRSPSLFLKILKRKCELYGGQIQTVNTRTFKASQYDHVRDEYIKVPLTQREKVVGGYTVQRDLYSNVIKLIMIEFKSDDISVDILF